MVIFHSYVKLPEGHLCDLLSPEIDCQQEGSCQGEPKQSPWNLSRREPSATILFGGACDEYLDIPWCSLIFRTLFIRLGEKWDILRTSSNHPPVIEHAYLHPQTLLPKGIRAPFLVVKDTEWTHKHPSHGWAWPLMTIESYPLLIQHMERSTIAIHGKTHELSVAIFHSYFDIPRG